MPSYYCKMLQTTLHFLPNAVKFCCSCAEGPGVKIKDYNNINKKEIEQTRLKFINALRNGEIPKECKGCFEYKQTEIPKKGFFESLFKKEEKFPVNYIIVDHYKQCDCSCVYCSQKILYGDNVTQYALLPLIKQLYANNMIDSYNLKVEFQGGNISCLNEFDSLLEEFKKNKCRNYAVLSNGIKYMPQLENMDSNSFICISLDCGTRETFNKIKNVDGFDSTIENIKRLRENSNICIALKYIVINGINDNMDEVNAFLNIAKDLVKNGSVIFDIDYRDTILNINPDFKVPSHYNEIFKYAEEYCKQNNIPFTAPVFTKNILEQPVNK